MSIDTSLVMLPGGPAPRYTIRANPTGTASAVVYLTPNLIALSRHPELLEAMGDAFIAAARDLRMVHEDLIAEPIGTSTFEPA